MTKLERAVLERNTEELRMVRGTLESALGGLRDFEQRFQQCQAQLDQAQAQCTKLIEHDKLMADHVRRLLVERERLEALIGRLWLRREEIER